ncbi:MAG: hypothetical protein PHG15_00730 [Acinetobacter sp.]|uniref:hypothetical protein n=1 Tax=Acinetobacter sp. TaxID=472 RepID=UPI0026064048|nr:hypothetical protein [Acinetobacter sp.]MDD2944343.1 hypothetical protein [Acinetobacter sp.]
MNTLSNVIDNIIFAVFFTFVGALLASSLILWFYADEKFLSVMCFALFAVLCYITFSLTNFRFKSEISELAVSLLKLTIASLLSFLGCYFTQLTYDLAITSDSSYLILSFISVIFMVSQLFSVYINLNYSVKLSNYLSKLYKSAA